MGTPKATRLSGHVVFFARPFDSRASEMCSHSATFRYFCFFKTTRLLVALIKKIKVYILFCIDKRYVKVRYSLRPRRKK